MCRNDISKKIVLDIETTGMNKNQPYYQGHRIIEIGAVEIIHRRLTGRYFHIYLNPSRSIDLEAFNIHGISETFLNDKPKFSEIANDFLDFISGGVLVIHNASFDVTFIDYELSMLRKGNLRKIASVCKVIDTLKLARKLFPGKKNSLDALCKRYCVNNATRDFHSALLDARLLANVFLLMTGGQISMFFGEDFSECYSNDDFKNKQSSYGSKGVVQCATKVIYASIDDIAAHNQYLNILKENSNNGSCIWYGNI